MTIQFRMNKILNYVFLRVLVENYQNTPHLSCTLVYIDVLGDVPSLFYCLDLGFVGRGGQKETLGW